MKKVININLKGRVIPIEETAFDLLQNYIEKLRLYFREEESKDEIISDIEDRIAEILEKEIKKGSACITDEKIEQTIGIMGKVEDFIQMDERSESPSTHEIPYKTQEKQGLFRNTNDKVFGGVCSGLAHSLKIDPVVLRILFVLFVLGWGTGILLYIILWLVLPERSMVQNIQKRFFRNPDSKVFGGVAGGIASYFNIPVWIPRLVFLLPLLSGFLADELPFIIIGGGFGGSFVLAYLLTWMFVPLASTPTEKMQMRGEKIDIQSITNSVKKEVEDIKLRSGEMGEKIKAGASRVSEEIRSNTGSRVLQVLAGLVKVFALFLGGLFAFVAMIIVGALLVVSLVSYPVHDFVFTEPLQKISFWGMLFLFFVIPFIGLIIWFLRKLFGLKQNKFLSLGLGSLWFLGWISLFLFASSVGKDFTFERSVQSSASNSIPNPSTLLVKVGAEPITYSDNYSWLNLDGAGFDISEDSMKYNNVSIKVEKAADSNYSANIIKYSFGKTKKIAEERAGKILFNAFFKDSTLLMENGIGIDKKSGFRGQRAEVIIAVPIGKRIIFDENISDAYSAFEIKTRKGKRERDADIIEHDFEFEVGVPYIMTENGLILEGGVPSIKEKKPVNEVIKTEDKPKQIAERKTNPFFLFYPAIGFGGL
ncbi:MAG: PspC domain-containing protein [Bacteroidota bacterium]